MLKPKNTQIAYKAISTPNLNPANSYTQTKQADRDLPRIADFSD